MFATSKPDSTHLKCNEAEGDKNEEMTGAGCDQN
jgi:hypothetical protein